MLRFDRAFLHRLLLAAFILNVLLLTWYLCVDYRAYLHSDSAVKNILAQEMLDTGSYFPAQWHYVNGDLWVLFTHTLVLPFLLVLKNGWAAHAGAGMLAAALVLHATWLLARDIGGSRTAALVTLVLVSAGISLVLAENLYGQAAYGLLYSMGVWLLACSLRAVQATGRRRLAWTAATALVLLFVFWANPQRAAAYYLAPLLAAGLAVQCRRATLPRRSDVVLGAVLMAAAALGTLLYVATCQRVNASIGIAPQYVSLATMADNAARLLHGLLVILNALPTVDSKVTHPRGVLAAGGLVAAFALLFVLLPWSVARAWRSRHAQLDAAVTFVLAGLAVAAFFAVTTSLTEGAAPDGVIRYAVPHFVMLLVVFTGIAVDRSGPARPVTLAAWVVMALFAARGLAVYGPVTAADYRRVHTQQADRMLDFMRQHGLQYGYAPFWEAGRMTVMANFDVRLRQILIVNGLPVPMRHLASDRWYEPDTWQGRTFLLLNTDEQKAFRPELMAAHAGPPQAVLDFEGWRIVVYDHNIAADLPTWDMVFRKPRHFAADESMLHQVGRVEDQAIVAEPGQSGALAFGQNLGVARGRYLVTFDIDAEGAGGPFGTVDVVSAAGTVRHGDRPVVAGRQRIVVPVTFDHATTPVELRAFSNGIGRVTLHGITLQAVKE